MNFNVIVKFGETLVEMFWQSCEVKRFVVHLLEKYSKTTDNLIDDVVVSAVKEKLLVNCQDR